MIYFANIWHSIQVFGVWHRNTLQAIFPPFYGWGMGCGYCCREEEAVQRRKCARGGQHGYRGCGTNEQENGKTTLRRLQRTLRYNGWDETAKAFEGVDMLMREYAFTKDPLTQDADQLARELRALVQEWTSNTPRENNKP